MKKITAIFFIIIIIIILCFLIFYKIQTHSLNNESAINSTQSQKDLSNSVLNNGWLHTEGSLLKNEKNEIIQLRGLSSHGIDWFSDVITYENLKNLKEDWNINTFRVAMYTDSNGQGYIYNPQRNKEKVCNIVDMAIDLGMYVIIDWHILNDNNPQIHQEAAKTFFDEISKKYANKPNVIYEICNEPNGNDVIWEKHVKPYAEEIIPIIRNNSENSLIIVGTPNWCKKINQAADNPLDFENIVYSCHFYSGTDGSELRQKIDYCIEKNVPIFVSECGLTDFTGAGEVYLESFKEWINYLNLNNISWLYWSFSNKDEPSAVLKPNYMSISVVENSESDSANISNIEKYDIPDIVSEQNILIDNQNTENEFDEQNIDFNEYLTESGKFIKSIFQSYNN